jgi:hypothetical protein
VPAFQRRFPGINLTIVVDNTNTHASRANVQLALGSVVIDLIQLESVHDFYRWKAQTLNLLEKIYNNYFKINIFIIYKII